MYGIIDKETKAYFSGFDANNRPTWTADKSKAWSDSKLGASCQASLLVCNGFNVQKRPVVL